MSRAAATSSGPARRGSGAVLIGASGAPPPTVTAYDELKRAWRAARPAPVGEPRMGAVGGPAAAAAAAAPEGRVSASISSAVNSSHSRERLKCGPEECHLREGRGGVGERAGVGLVGKGLGGRCRCEC